MPTTDTTVSNLIINKLTKQQYESIQNPSDTELYLVPDEIDSTPTSGSDNPVTSGGVYDALQDKADKVSGATSGNFAGLDANGNLTDSGYDYTDFVQIGNLPAYTIVKLGTAETGYIASYILQKDGVQEGATINIPKDYLVKSGSVVDVVLYSGHYYESTDTDHTTQLDAYGVNAEGKYLKFVVNTADSSSGTGNTSYIYIAVEDLVDVYTEGNGIDISNLNVISISIDNSNSNGLSTSSNGLALATAVASSGGTGGSNGAMSAQDKEKLNSIASGAEVNVQSDWNQTNNTADDYIKNKPNYASSASFGGPATKAVSIPFGGLELTSTSTALIATVDGITELRDGVCCYLSNNQIDSEKDWTLNINSLGAKPVYCTLEQNSRTQSAFLKGYTMLFVYNSSRVTGGCWDMYYGGNGNIPVLEQIYENYTCAAANADEGYIYFMKVHPTSDNWYNPWYVHYTLEITTDRPECQGLYDITIGASGNTYHYRVFNKFYSASYLPTYYHLVTLHNSAAKYAERDTYPIRLGERIWSSYQATTRARTYKIKVYDYSGCSIEFPESIESHGSFYDADHYGTLPTFDATKVGVLDNYDANTLPYQYYEYYTNYKIHDASTPLYRYRICGFDGDNKLVPLTITDRVNATQNVIFPTQVPMKVGNGMVWYSTTTTISTGTGRTATGVLYRGYTQGGTPFQYNFNGIPQNNCTIYACGSYDAVNGEFYLDTTTTTSWYVCVPDTISQDTDISQYFTEGMYYWMIGVVGSTSIYGAVYLDHPVYLFDGKELVSTDNLYSIQTPSRWNNQLFTERSTYGKNSIEATIDKIMGMSLSWNQRALEYAVANGTMATEDGITTVTPNSSDCRYILRTVSGSNNTTPVNGHMYLQTAMVKSNVPVAFGNINGGMVGNSPIFDFQEGDDFRRCSDIYLSTSGTASTIQMYSPTGDPFYVKDGSFMLFNLTEMFGKGHEPDIKKFFELFPREVYDYCDGRIIDSYVGQETITTYDSEGNHVDSIQVGSNTTLRSSCIDYDEIKGTTKITRVGTVNLGDLTWVLYNASKKIFRCAGFSDTYGADRTKGSATYVTMLCGGHVQRTTDNSAGNLANRQFFLGGTSGDLYMCDTRYSTAEAFTEAVDGVYLNFPLLTPVESTIEDIGTPSYKCSLDGTEEAVNARQSSLESTPTCTPFRCCLSYKQNTSLDKADKVQNATNGNFAGLDATGNLTDSGYSPSDFALESTVTTRHVVEHITEMTSEQVDALSEGDVVIADSFAYFVGVKSNTYCYLLNSANRQMQEHVYVKRGQTWYYLEYRAKYPPSVVGVVGITNITNEKCAKATWGDSFYDSNTKKTYIVAFKDLTELFLIYVDITIVEKVLYQQINNSWTYVQTDIISLSSISDVANKADKVSNSTNGNFAGLDSNGNLTDSGKKASDFIDTSETAQTKGGQITVSATTGNGIITGSTSYRSFTGISSIRQCQDDSNNVNVAGFIINSDGASKFIHRRGGITNNEDAYMVFDATGMTYRASGTKGNTTLTDILSISASTNSLQYKGTDVALVTDIPSITGKADKVQNATNGNFAGLDSSGNLTDSGSKASDFLTSHQDISGKADKILYVSAATPPASLDPNKVYQFGTLSGNTTFPAFSAVAAGDTEVKIWCWTFTTPSNAPTITWPAGITAWNGGSAPTIIGSKNYEVNVMDGVACILETDIPT